MVATLKKLSTVVSNVTNVSNLVQKGNVLQFLPFANTHLNGTWKIPVLKMNILDFDAVFR